MPFALLRPDSVAFGGHGWKPEHRARAGRQGRRRRRAGRGRNDSRWVGGWMQPLTCCRAVLLLHTMPFLLAPLVFPILLIRVQAAYIFKHSLQRNVSTSQLTFFSFFSSQSILLVLLSIAFYQFLLSLGTLWSFFFLFCSGGDKHDVNGLCWCCYSLRIRAKKNFSSPIFSLQISM